MPAPIVQERRVNQAARSEVTSSVASDLDRQGTLAVGTAPVNWNNDDLPNWRPFFQLSNMLEAMSGAGYSGTEYGARFPRDPVELKSELEPRGLSLCGSFQWFHFHHPNVFALELADLDNVLKALSSLDCHNLIVASAMTAERIAIAGQVPEDGGAGLPDQGWSALADGLVKIRDRAATYEVRVHFHNHVGSHVESPAEVERLVEQLPIGVDLCFDTGHYAFGGGDSLHFVERFADKIGYLHLKDVDKSVLKEAQRDHLGFLNALRKFIFCELGQGMVDVPAIVSRLQSSGYTGWIIVEQDTCQGDPTETAARNRKYLQTACGI
jgi:inosose dehydratase